MDAFARVWSTCNLCEAEGRHFVIAGRDDDVAWLEMEAHTIDEHPDHIALLQSGAEYRPTNPTVFDVMAGDL